MDDENKYKIISIIGLILSISALILSAIFSIIGYFTGIPLNLAVFLIGVMMCVGSVIIAIYIFKHWDQAGNGNAAMSLFAIGFSIFALVFLLLAFLGLYWLIQAIMYLFGRPV